MLIPQSINVSPSERVNRKVPAAFTTMSSQIDKTSSPEATLTPKFRLVIHGGTGTMDKALATPELRAQYNAALKDALGVQATRFLVRVGRRWMPQSPLRPRWKML